MLEIAKRVVHASRLLRAIVRPIAERFLPPEGPEGIERLGHRRYVGGSWEEIGRLQLDFLRSRGLEPHHHLLDVACGALRAGVHFVPYLEPGHYHGIEKERSLIEAGIEELGEELFRTKRPDLVVSADFAFDRLTRPPDFAIVNSLFTHLPAHLIETCLTRLRGSCTPRTEVYATFFETSAPERNLSRPHDHASFWYTADQMAGMGRRAGWSSTYIGDWGHPRKQSMIRYTPAGS